MTVRFTQFYLGPGRYYDVGQILDLDDATARDAIDKGRAVPVTTAEQRQTAINTNQRRREKRAH